MIPVRCEGAYFITKEGSYYYDGERNHEKTPYQQLDISMKLFMLKFLVFRAKTMQKICEELNVNPNQYRGGGALWPPYSFSSISPERLELRPSNFLTFSFYLLAVNKKYKYVNIKI